MLGPIIITLNGWLTGALAKLLVPESSLIRNILPSKLLFIAHI
jgi:hypothetical protein